MLGDLDKTYKSIVPRTRGVNPREAFYAWMKTGTLKKAGLYMMNEKGLYNVKADKPFSPFGIRHAACRFIATNHLEAKPVLMKSWEAQGTHVTDDEWERFVVDLATNYLNSSKKRFMRWLEANSWAEEYDYIYARKFGLEPENSPKV